MTKRVMTTKKSLRTDVWCDVALCLCQPGGLTPVLGQVGDLNLWVPRGLRIHSSSWVMLPVAAFPPLWVCTAGPVLPSAGQNTDIPQFLFPFLSSLILSDQQETLLWHWMVTERNVQWYLKVSFGTSVHVYMVILCQYSSIDTVVPTIIQLSALFKREGLIQLYSNL